MDLFCDVLLEWERRYFDSVESGEREKFYSGNHFGSPRKRIRETDVYYDVLKEPAGEFRANSIPDRAAVLLLSDWTGLPDGEDEEIVKVDRLTSNEICRCGLFIILPD